MSLKRLIQQALGVLRTLPGRLFLMSVGVLLLISAWQAAAPLPDLLDLFRKVVVLSAIVSVVWLLAQALVRGQRQWLWAVRRKLILSYVFFGVFPVALVVVFVGVAGFILYMNAATYLFHTGYQSLVDQVALIAETSAVEISQNPSSASEVLERKVKNLKIAYPAISLASLHRTSKGKFAAASAGPWRNVPAPTSIPDWLVDQPEKLRSPLALVKAGSNEEQLLIRQVRVSPDGQEFVVVDLPVDSRIIELLHDSTSARIEGIKFTDASDSASPLTAETVDAVPRETNGTEPVRSLATAFRHAWISMDYASWESGASGRVTVFLDAPVGELYGLMTSASGWDSVTRSGIRFLLLGVAFLFVVIQASAFIGGVALARRITSAIHHLFYGTARIGQGDFTHRIPIGSNDQLGDLAGSFNNMSTSIEHLRQIERDKLRLDEELGIARRIQRSLLPNSVPQIAGLCISDLCEPAMEVGGDYYDFFPLGPRQLGVLVADVSGKGTSAALYMAELKGLMLALSRTHRSPRALLVELNDLLADHLDNRSFITMTYAVIDLDAGTLTSARAGHTPMLFVRDGASDLVISDGMVLGLRLPDAARRFGEILKEHTQPIRPGDVIVLYTDGITEAMNTEGDLFGDAALSAVVAAHHDLSSAGIRERILRDVRAFVGDAEPHDDMTMVVLKLQEPA